MHATQYYIDIDSLQGIHVEFIDNNMTSYWMVLLSMFLRIA